MLPPLLIRTERVAASVAHGLHGRRRAGPGETFWQFRGYQPGDSTRRIDWRKSAKSQRLFVRQTEWEAAQNVWLWRDASASMQYRSSERWPKKVARAELLLLAIASLLARGGERLIVSAQETPGYMYNVQEMAKEKNWKRNVFGTEDAIIQLAMTV